MEKHRTAVSILLIVVGAGLLLYGLSSRAGVASSSEQSQVQVPPTSEVPAMQPVAADGKVAQETPGQAKKTEETPKKAAAACPT